MKLYSHRHIIIFLVLTTLLAITGCSTQKNTARSRWWHSFNARYNTYYNGTLAYIDGSLEKENGNKDNFTEMIPLYTVTNKNSRELGKSNYETAILKCEKAIHQHSIKKRPEWTKNRRKTAKDIEWLNRKEYNPFLWKAWMLMGRSQFFKGDFDGAAATFAYMSRLYATQPAIYGRARAWLAKCYIEQDWRYDAEDVIRNMQRDSIHWRAQKEWDYTYADYYIHIAMSEVMAKGNAKKMIARLKRMASSDNNKEYLDQVYYAMGNIYLNEKDTVHAISAYENGNAKATRSGIEKGVLLLHLGDLYWGMEKYSDAQRCYGEAIGLLDKDRKDYQQLSDRSKVLDELVPHTEAVHLQDSLQALAQMDEKDRNAAIDRVISALKKKEKEEKDKLAEQESNRQQAMNGGNNVNRNNKTNTTSSATNTGQKGAWYFYNPIAVSQGKTQFQRLWGKRENVDNWQRINKTVVAAPEGAEEMTDEMRDSLIQVAEKEDSIKEVTDSAQNDPHKREYYLAQIPFTPEQIAASNLLLEDALYNSGVIFKDKLDNLTLSEKALRRLEDNYKDFEHMDDVYYHLYLLYSRKGMPSTADNYIDKLKKSYPESQWTTLLTDPYYKENAQFGVHIEDSLYAATYEAFKASRYSEAKGNARISGDRFPNGANRDNFLFIGGLSKLNDGDAKGCIDDMKTVVEKYPESRISEMAGMIVNGVNAGKRLHGGKFDLEDVWNRRSITLNTNDSIQSKGFTDERNANFAFLFVYQPDSINENQLLFEVAKFNFTHYLVRNFDLSIEEQDGLRQMKLTGFRNYDEAWQYARTITQQESVAKASRNSRLVIISESNLELLGRAFTYQDYEKYFQKHFSSLKITPSHTLWEPTEIVTEKKSETTEAGDEEVDEENGISSDSDNILDIEDDTSIKENQSTIMIPDVPENKLLEDKRTTIEEIKTETKPTTSVPSTNDTILEEKVSKQKKTSDEKKSEIKKTSDENNASETKKEIKKQPIEEDSDIIIFDDDTDITPTPKNQKKENGQKKDKTKKDDNFDLEDEYYDLDGF